MVLYRRNRLAGGTFFFTVTLRDRRCRWLTDCIGDLRAAYRTVQRRNPFTTVAIVVLPDHLHAIWALPPGDCDYSGRWRSTKSGFTHALLDAGRIRRVGDSPRIELWQSRFWEHTIRDELDLSRHVDYIHYNPVKHGHANRVIDWPYSSFHRYLRAGTLPADWGGGVIVGAAGDSSFGE